MQEEKIFNDMRGGGGDKYPFFSLIVLSYNKEPFIRKSLESCINQTFKDFEIIVVDDCSQDNTPSILQEYQAYKNLTVIQNPSNSGAFASRIIGEEYAKGEYIIHIDGDDFVKETMCEVLYPLCKTNQWDIIGFGWINIGLDGKHTTMLHTIGEHKVLNVISNIGIPTYAFKAHNIKKANLFITQQLFQKIPHINNLEDALKPFIVSMFSNNYRGINEVLYFCQNNIQSMTANCKNIEKNFRMVQDLKIVLGGIFATIDFFNFPEKKSQFLKQHITNSLSPILKSYQYIYYHSKAYENKPFTYPINFLKSLWYTRSPKIICKTLVRVFVYFITLGKTKI